MVNNRVKNASLYLVRIALIAALLTSGKFALSFIPNVEIVTIIIMVVASSLGLRYAFPSIIIFCSMEMALYGIGSWTLLYFIYWPLLALVSSLLLKKKNIIVAIIIAILGSILFGVLSACCDTLFCVFDLSSSDLSIYFMAYYLRGVTFDVIHLVSNIILILILYIPLTRVVQRLMPYEYNSFYMNSRKLFKISDEYIREDK